MKLAAFNLENLFDRAQVLSLPTWQEGKPILEEFQRLNSLLNKPKYSSTDKQKIVASLKTMGLDKSDGGREFVTLRQNRGKLLKRPAGKPVEIVAGGRGDWIGWVELKTGPANETATRNTAQVIRDVGADVLGVVEADNRIALRRFSDQVLPMVGAAPYEHIMLIDGNDDRGIDVGLVTRGAFPICSMRSHVDDEANGSRIFSRDCPEYEIALPSGQILLVLVNHLKSKGFGSKAASDAKRRAQAARVRTIYEERLAAGTSLIAVIGDFNDFPDDGPLDPLLKSGSSLRDVSLHPNFQGDGRPGTFGNGTKTQKFDYILLSPQLVQAVTTAGVFRKGVWGGKNGTLWPVYQEMTEAIHAASDHAAIWVELNI